MKNILFILIACLMVSVVNAAPTRDARQERRQQLVHEYLTRALSSADLNKENEFGDTPVFTAAQNGDVSAILRYGKRAANGSFLLRTGKNGNNVFHVARNAQTFQALARVLRDFYPGDYKIKIRQMMNQRNQLGETPVQAQINYGRADTFRIAFPYTDMYDKMMTVKTKLNKGGLIAEVAKTEAAVVVEMSKDASGRTIAQAARDNASAPGMAQVIAFFQNNAPYL
ncbi:hypothetical protein [Candidatus Avelusimicrobium gallicola]|uniref:Uncharacterized protein n=1 Tax=Candidatus Avelusimicrobium gallicola TaxID=2562704 RepID=A0A1Y4DEP2_9BACT|nr:hypothetical protein [Elusimicrobium sp. An273]OUO57594.1 hypothetical protein B5F75_02125 [Elusimicrobium sp. An273]